MQCNICNAYQAFKVGCAHLHLLMMVCVDDDDGVADNDDDDVDVTLKCDSK